MSFLGLPHTELRKALAEIDQALFHHEQWTEELNRTLICRLVPDEANLTEDAHKRCRFGQWLYGPSGKTLAKHPGVAEIAEAHKRMHRYGRDLSLSASRHESPSISDYERFVTSLKQLRLEAQTIKRELEDALFNLDPLTGAANRIGMLTKLREQQELVKRKVHFCCVAMFDLDHFRAINEKYGHHAGDRVLATVARRLMDRVRPYDTLFRYGGEEFLLCLANTDLTTGMTTVENLRTMLADSVFESDGGEHFHVTVSCGLTLLDADVSVEESIQRADKALFAAKAAGRNRSIVWDVSMI